jgi:hypothetical protein
MSDKRRKTGVQVKGTPNKAKEPKSKGGRPSGYSPEYVGQAEKLSKLGATVDGLADFFGVCSKTIERWAARYPEFCLALKIGGAPCDDRVERSLYHRATGYSFKSEKVFQFQGEIVRTATVEHVPPDTTAAIFWLKNRRKEQWRDKSEVDQTVKSEVSVTSKLEEIYRKLFRISAVQEAQAVKSNDASQDS